MTSNYNHPCNQKLATRISYLTLLPFRIFARGIFTNADSTPLFTSLS